MRPVRFTRHLSVPTLLSAMACAALLACGGGQHDEAAPDSASAATPDASATSVRALDSWQQIANEYQAFSVQGTQTVRYGSDTRWVQKSVSGNGMCTNAFFGSDPARGVDKVCQVFVSTPTGGSYGDFHAASLGNNANLNGAIAFPADNAWNKDVSAAPRDPNSDNLIASIGLSGGLHNDFGSGTYDGGPIGIPYVVVSGAQPLVKVQFTDYADESDPGPYPVPRTAPVEGGPSSAGDRHVLVIDKDHNRLYEMGNAYPNSDGSWRASGGAVFDLASDIVRPGGQPGWTSADAAGLPIFPGIVRYEEAALGPGGIRHALRFTVQRSRRAYVPPATHWASSNTSANLPPMGMRVRLKASYVIPSSYSPETKAILTALKTYGMFVADNGSNWFLSGAPDARWNNDRLHSELGEVKGSNFEVVRMDGLVTP